MCGSSHFYFQSTKFKIEFGILTIRCTIPEGNRPLRGSDSRSVTKRDICNCLSEEREYRESDTPNEKEMFQVDCSR